MGQRLKHETGYSIRQKLWHRRLRHGTEAIPWDRGYKTGAIAWDIA